MVARVTTTWCLIAVLVLCPFACMGPAGATCAEQDAGHHQAALGSCCPPAKCPDGDGAPCDRHPAERAASCLCHGALLADQSPALDLQPVPVFWLVQELPMASGTGGRAWDVTVENSACHFPSLDSGRELRALIQSFLL